MKKLILLISLLALIGVFTLSEGCKKDSDPEIGIEVPNLPAEMMTLSAIAYTADSMTVDIIKDSILYQLANTSLATRGKWELVWGPGISSHNENLSYVVRDTTEDIVKYAISIRGTNANSIKDIIEDADVFKLSAFTYGKPGDSVSKGSMDGFNYLLTSKDPVVGTTLEEYLESISTTSKTPLYVTGHSQGGGLCPLMAYWLTTHNTFKDKFLCSSYAFAGPGWINKSFRDNYLAEIPQGASFNMYVNTLDMIPYGYANLPQINSKNIPVHVPLLYRIAIGVADSILISKGIEYYNIVVADSIGNIPITASAPGGLTPHDSIKWFNHWLGIEHSHNNYLLLLGVEPVN